MTPDLTPLAGLAERIRRAVHDSCDLNRHLPESELSEEEMRDVISAQLEPIGEVLRGCRRTIESAHGALETTLEETLFRQDGKPSVFTDCFTEECKKQKKLLAKLDALLGTKGNPDA